MRWVPLQSVLMFSAVSLGVGFRGQWQSSVGFIVGACLLVVAAGIGIAGVLTLGTNRTAKPDYARYAGRTDRFIPWLV